ncbi:Gfo/Idh/MocA family oxidoreductase [Zhihengliuella sp. ISTPL4]|uniref:Gfo/Idh/MocA family oxidoreductase n=1 Tax=Zhihengliuella sp. ISTPL4 TaxID=2058657 RepID=UPI000C79C38F|nr:Gfo/Idh/MocA family oxidoreductase [Zhihengliuella sp. ISTPL4]
MKSVGIVGIENSHATEIVRFLNADAAEVPVRITALVAGEPERTRELADLGGIERVVDDAAALRGTVDALIVTARDGADHRALAVPFLEAGVPVWVDKPLAATVADADAILAAAERGRAPVTSSSTLRWLADTAELTTEAARVGEVQAVTVTGPADPDSPYSGIFFYGIHIADLAQVLRPGTAEDVEVRFLPAGIVVRSRVDGVPVTLEFVRPDGDRQVPFRATVVGRHGIASREIPIGPGYVRPGVRAFAGMLETGELPVPASEMRAPIAVLEQVAEALASR